MKKISKDYVKGIIKERIQSMTATKNPDDAKYDLTIVANVRPSSIYNLNTSHPSFKINYHNVVMNRHEKLSKEVTFQGHYAKTGNFSQKTLRLKINKEDWPEEWKFPKTELDRRLFLQNFRLSNLDIITKFDEGGEEYDKIFSEEEIPEVEVEFEESEESEEPEESEETVVPDDEIVTIEDVLEFLDILRNESLTEGEIDISKEIAKAYRELVLDIVKSKREK